MIEPGKITVELLMEPGTYIIVTAALTAIIGMTSAYIADRFADEAVKEKLRKENPEADVSEEWDLENGDKLSIACGLLVVISTVWPLMNVIDQVGGFFGLLAVSVFAGWGARKILPTFADRFVSKGLEIKP